MKKIKIKIKKNKVKLNKIKDEKKKRRKRSQKKRRNKKDEIKKVHQEYRGKGRGLDLSNLINRKGARISKAVIRFGKTVYLTRSTVLIR